MALRNCTQEEFFEAVKDFTNWTQGSFVRVGHEKEGELEYDTIDYCMVGNILAQQCFFPKSKYFQSAWVRYRIIDR